MNCEIIKVDVIVYLIPDVSLLFESVSGESTIFDLRNRIYKIFALDVNKAKICDVYGSIIANSEKIKNLQRCGTVSVRLAILNM